MFNYKEELKRYFGRVGGIKEAVCSEVKCADCMFDGRNFDDGKDRCNISHAEECVELVKKWAEENPREIDWNKVPVDTKVLVKESYDKSWTTGYYCMFLPNNARSHVCFDNRAKQETAVNLKHWYECRFYPDVEIQEEWYK